MSLVVAEGRPQCRLFHPKASKNRKAQRNIKKGYLLARISGSMSANQFSATKRLFRSTETKSKIGSLDGGSGIKGIEKKPGSKQMCGAGVNRYLDQKGRLIPSAAYTWLCRRQSGMVARLCLYVEQVVFVGSAPRMLREGRAHRLLCTRFETAKKPKEGEAHKQCA